MPLHSPVKQTELLWEAMMFNNKYSQHDINQYRFIYDEKEITISDFPS